MRKHTSFTDMACCCLVILAMNSIVSSDDRPALDIKALDILTKGFPAILRITAHGPQRIPKMSLFDELGDVVVTLVSEDGNKKYEISSSQGMGLMVTTQAGHRNDAAARRMFEFALAKGEKRTILIDLSCLRPEIGKGTILWDVPSGQYSLTVSFPSADTTSLPVRVEIVDRTNAEQAFLEDVIDAGVSLKRGSGVNWSKVLRDRVPIESAHNLRKETEVQTQFHMLLSHVLRRGTLSRKSVEEFPVPEYLRGEKESLLVELDTLNDRQSCEKSKEELVKRYPDLKWRHEESTGGIGLFLRHRKSE